MPYLIIMNRPTYAINCETDTLEFYGPEGEGIRMISGIEYEFINGGIGWKVTVKHNVIDEQYRELKDEIWPINKRYKTILKFLSLQLPIVDFVYANFTGNGSLAEVKGLVTIRRPNPAYIPRVITNWR